MTELTIPGEAASVRDGFAVMWRRKFWLLAASAVFLFVGVLVTALQTPVYEASSTVEIESGREQFLNMTTIAPAVPMDVSGTDAYIQTQIELLQSKSLLQTVGKKVALPAPKNAARQTGGIAVLRAFLSSARGEPGQAVELAKETLKVNSVRGTRIIRLKSESTDPVVAADFVNALTSVFAQRGLENRWNGSETTRELLTRQVQELKLNLEKSEATLQNYARASGLIFMGEKENLAEERLRQLQAEFSKALADRTTAQSRAETSKGTSSEAIPEVVDNLASRSYESMLTDLRRQLADATTLLSSKHYKVRQLEAQIASLESALEKERLTTLEKLQNQYREARRREALLSREFDSHSKYVSDNAMRAIKYQILKREVETNRALYEAMMQKVKEAAVTSALHAANVRVVDPAQVPTEPHKPNLALNIALALSAGCFCTVLGMLTKDRWDNRLRSPGETSVFLQTPELGVIPFTRLRAPVPKLLMPGRDRRVVLANRNEANTEMMESYRSTLASILHLRESGNDVPRMVVTSANAGEGKTTTVANLGIALARIHNRVLLVDADFSRPQLHNAFNLDNDKGLSQLLRNGVALDSAALERVVKSTSSPGLYVLANGAQDEEIPELLRSATAAQILLLAGRSFDSVIIDSPPVLCCADARIWGRQADGVVLVLRAGATQRRAAGAAMQRLVNDHIPVLGTILNAWDSKSDHSYYGGYKYQS